MMYNYRQPLMVVYCSSGQDVAAAVAFAAQRRLPLCPRAGGHDSIGASICEGGVVVDVSGMTQVWWRRGAGTWHTACAWRVLRGQP